MRRELSRPHRVAIGRRCGNAGRTLSVPPSEGSRIMPQTNKPATDNSAGQSTTSPKLAPSEARQPDPREGSTMWAAIEVLRSKRKMTAAEIYAEIRERNLAPNLKGKTPEQTIAARLAVAAKRGLGLSQCMIGPPVRSSGACGASCSGSPLDEPLEGATKLFELGPELQRLVGRVLDDLGDKKRGRVPPVRRIGSSAGST